MEFSISQEPALMPSLGKALMLVHNCCLQLYEQGWFFQRLQLRLFPGVTAILWVEYTGWVTHHVCGYIWQQPCRDWGLRVGLGLADFYSVWSIDKSEYVVSHLVNTVFAGLSTFIESIIKTVWEFCCPFLAQCPLCPVRGEQRAVQEGLRVLLQAGLVHGQQEEGEWPVQKRTH